MLLRLLFAKTLHSGRLRVIHEDGSAETLGDGRGRPIAVRLTRRGAWRIATQRGLGLGEAYMEGDLTFEEGDLWDLLCLIGANLPERPARPASRLGDLRDAIIRRLRQRNDRRRAKANVAHHYDLSNDFYRCFLDPDLQYSCAYFRDPGMDLEAAQAAKKVHLASKLRLEPGMRVLDIGCGWGGMALTLARDYGCEVLGVTLSTQQLALARERARAARLGERVQFELCDYRDVEGPFDRIVSVGMFEHVGEPNYVAYFSKIRELLADDGLAVVHSIGRMEPPGVTNDFIAKYIFPGGYIPALSQVTPAIERSGLWITDIEVLRRHYAMTLRGWRERFLANWEAISAMYDERFCRMFEFYLATSELSFRTGTTMVMQVQLARNADALPITRDYMLEAERQVQVEPTGRRAGNVRDIRPASVPGGG